MYEGKQRLFSATIASAATLSAEIDLGHYWDRLMIEIPSDISGNVRLQVANSSGGTYRPVYTGFPDNDTSPAIFDIASSVSNCALSVPSPGRFVKVEMTSATTDGSTFYLIGIS